ncbi:MAG: DUF4926 domain-containing protein [Rhizomicrobium sp.]
MEASLSERLGTEMMIENAVRLKLLDVVALLNDREGLARGQVGTIVELLDGGTALVEFSDGEGRAFATLPCPLSELIVLHYERQPA